MRAVWTLVRASLGAAICGLAVLTGTPALAARQPDAATAEPGLYTLAFQDALIAQVAQEVLTELGVGYRIDPSVTGKMTFRIDQRLTRAQLLQAFEAALAANNVALVRDGETLVVTSKVAAKAVGGVKPVGEGVRGIGYQVVAVPLSYASASEVAKALEAISGKDIVVHSSDQLGLIVLGGSGQEIQSALETLRVFDQSALQASKIRWFDLAHAPAETVAGEVQGLLRTAGVTGVGVVPLKRLNGIIVFGRTSTALDEVSQWVLRLDAPTKDAVSTLWVYHPKNTSAEALSLTLNSLMSGSSTSAAMNTRPAGTPAASASAPMESANGGQDIIQASAGQRSDDYFRAAVDKETNTLLVSAPAWQWVKIQKILGEIDHPQAQLLIEATIVEVTLGSQFRLGLDWSVLSNSNRLQVAQNQTSDGTVAAAYPGFSITYLSGDVQAALNALGSKTNVEVVSAPKVVTLDNHTARLEVGDQIPIIVQTSQGTTTAGSPLVNSVDYRNSGVILTVTPRISGEGRIQMAVSQEVSSAVKTDTSGIDSPTIQQRKLESTLVLNDGGSVALGGLISRTRSRGDSGVPFLKDVPGLGLFFKTGTDEAKRTELIVLLSAKILKDQAAADQALTDLSTDLREIQSRGLLHEAR